MLEHEPMVRLIRDAEQLPDTYDRAEHTIEHIQVCGPPASDPEDDRYSLTFQTSTGRCLRIRIAGEHVAALGRALLALAQERAFEQ
jgi:hypothetical protein